MTAAGQVGHKKPRTSLEFFFYYIYTHLAAGREGSERGHQDVEQICEMMNWERQKLRQCGPTRLLTWPGCRCKSTPEGKVRRCPGHNRSQRVAAATAVTQYSAAAGPPGGCRRPSVGTESGSLTRNCRQVTAEESWLTGLMRQDQGLTMRAPYYKTMHKNQDKRPTKNVMLVALLHNWMGVSVLYLNCHEKQYTLINFLFFYLSEYQVKAENNIQ